MVEQQHVEVGAEVQGGFRPGDHVMCAGSGAYAEYAVADWGRTVRKPASLSFEEAACLMVAVSTMHDALISNGRLQKGEAVMIQGASSGVGIMGLQIAKLNVDENREVPAKFGIRGIPTLMIFKNGQLAATKVGALSKAQLTAFIDGTL